MKSVCIIVALVAFVAFVKADSDSTFDKAVADALNNIEAGAKKFQEVTGIKTEFDKTKVQSFLTSGLGENKKKIEEILKNLETNTKPLSEDLKKNVDALSKQFAEAVKTLNSTENQGNIQKLQETFQKAFKSVVDQANNAAKTAGVTPSPEVQKNFNALVEELGKGAKIVQDRLQQVINEAQKKTA